jgi:hypothetical protein
MRKSASGVPGSFEGAVNTQNMDGSICQNIYRIRLAREVPRRKREAVLTVQFSTPSKTVTDLRDALLINAAR